MKNEALKKDALYAYLELCNAIGEVPRKDLYDFISECEDAGKLNEMTAFIEKQHGDYEKAKAQEPIKESHTTKFFNIFKSK